MRNRKIPRDARHLRTEKEFQSYLADFGANRYPFLWVVGRPGTGKTEAITAAVRGRKVYYRKAAQLTPLQLYIDCYRHLGQPIILDDAEHLLDNSLGAKLISALGDTSRVKHLAYGTTTRLLEDVPKCYHTTSPLCIIANRATAHEYLQSRAVTLYYDPTNLEIHRAAARWYWDQEIYDWFGQHLHRLEPVDSRWYVIADCDKRAGRNWQRIIQDAHVQNRAACIVQDLETDKAYPGREDKVKRFVELLKEAHGASRASYFRLRRRLEEEDRLIVRAVPTVRLRHAKPPTTPSTADLELLEQAIPSEPEEEPRPIDVPTAREEFSQPIQGHAQPPTTPSRPMLDDSLPGEPPERHEDDDE